VKSAVEMVSDGMTYIPSFMNIGAGVKVIRDTHRHTNSKMISQPYSYFSELWEVCCKCKVVLCLIN
jgi:hypothetical protein